MVGCAAASLFAIKYPEGSTFWILSAMLPVIPDFDALFMRWIPYAHSLGHRGFTHSLTFAALLGWVASLACGRATDLFPGRKLGLFLFFFAVTASHGLLDALTDGGLGVGFFIPFDNTRYFLPIQPMPVAPIGLARFFSARGLECLTVEFFLFWLFALAILLYRAGASLPLRVTSMLLAAVGLLSWVIRIRSVDL
jgi:inner membrane protein